jgi:hypothetical protein
MEKGYLTARPVIVDEKDPCAHRAIRQHFGCQFPVKFKIAINPTYYVYSATRNPIGWI